MTPHEERQLGEQLGRMEQGIRDLQQRFSRIERQLDDRVPWAWATAHERHAEERNARVDSLESSRDKFRGVLIAMGAVETVALFVIGFVVNH